ncbi:MAG: tetratricopeptide repeat protein [Pyrinomonadaceae bacterium]
MVVKLLLLIFYSPLRALREIRDHGSVIAGVTIAILTQVVYTFFVQWFYLGDASVFRSFSGWLTIFIQAIFFIVFLAIFYVPANILIANLFDRRASLRIALQQEYASLTAVVLYAKAAETLIAIPVSILMRFAGLETQFISWIVRTLEEARRLPPEFAGQGNLPDFLGVIFSLWIMVILFGVYGTLALRAVRGLTWMRSVLTVISSALVLLILLYILVNAGGIIFSPFLLIMLFILFRGFYSEMMRTHRSRANFKRNLEAATLNPADASAHYNLGLIYQERGEIDKAYERFERAVRIDPEEIDACYQLGRISRTQNKSEQAIRHFEQVVQHDSSHSFHEIWREVGATYLDAGQFADARDALERFLNHRSSDPEGLYLMGCALNGLGQRHEAEESMQACIEAVKAAPAYQYRAVKHWQDEAQQFIKSSQ